MLKTYKAVLNSNDRLTWLEERPKVLEKNKNVPVLVTILDGEPPKEPIKEGTLVEFFWNSPLYKTL